MMRTHRECLACFERQAAEAGVMAGLCDSDRDRVLEAVRRKIASFPVDHPPVEMARDIHEIVRSVSGVPDPYASIKRVSNEVCGSCMRRVRRQVARSPDPLSTAVKAAIAGNVIDYGAFPASRISPADVVEAVEEAWSRSLSGDSPEDLHEAAGQARAILYLADNAGECFLDRPLLERLPLGRLLYAVRGGPVLNDATREDAYAAGIQDLCRVVDTGDCAPGLVPGRCSREFLAALEGSDLVIAKGQGNYESLSGGGDRTYVFLTKVKCAVIARDIGFPVGSNVLRIVRPRSAAAPRLGATRSESRMEVSYA